MFIKLGIPRPNETNASTARAFINLDHIVTAEFSYDSKNIPTATIVTVKPGGSDRRIYNGDDALRILQAIETKELRTMLDHERPEPNPNPPGPVVNAEATVKMVKGLFK